MFCGADLCFSGGANRNFCKELAVWPQARPPRDRRARDLSQWAGFLVRLTASGLWPEVQNSTQPSKLHSDEVKTLS